MRHAASVSTPFALGSSRRQWPTRWSRPVRAMLSRQWRERAHGTGRPPRGNCECGSVALQRLCQLRDWPVHFGGRWFHHALKKTRQTCKEQFSGVGDVRFEDRAEPKSWLPRTSRRPERGDPAYSGSNLWPHRGLQPSSGPTPMGHEYCSLVEEVAAPSEEARRDLDARHLQCADQLIVALYSTPQISLFVRQTSRP